MKWGLPGQARWEPSRQACNGSPKASGVDAKVSELMKFAPLCRTAALRIGRQIALQERAVTGGAKNFSFLHRDPAAQYRHDRPTRYGQPFVRRVVGAVMHDFLTDHFLTVRIPDD